MLYNYVIIQLNETSILETTHIGRKKNYVNTFNQIVPSPVRAIINSPFKCTVSYFFLLK